MQVSVANPSVEEQVGPATSIRLPCLPCRQQEKSPGRMFTSGMCQMTPQSILLTSTSHSINRKFTKCIHIFSYLWQSTYKSFQWFFSRVLDRNKLSYCFLLNCNRAVTIKEDFLKLPCWSYVGHDPTNLSYCPLQKWHLAAGERKIEFALIFFTLWRHCYYKKALSCLLSKPWFLISRLE